MFTRNTYVWTLGIGGCSHSFVHLLFVPGLHLRQSCVSLLSHCVKPGKEKKTKSTARQVEEEEVEEDDTDSEESNRVTEVRAVKQESTKYAAVWLDHGVEEEEERVQLFIDSGVNKTTLVSERD